MTIKHNRLYCPPTHTMPPRWVDLTWGDPPSEQGCLAPWWRPVVVWSDYAGNVL